MSTDKASDTDSSSLGQMYGDNWNILEIPVPAEFEKHIITIMWFLQGKEIIIDFDKNEKGLVLKLEGAKDILDEYINEFKIFADFARTIQI